jgi:hypothetical protein
MGKNSERRELPSRQRGAEAGVQNTQTARQGLFCQKVACYFSPTRQSTCCRSMTR